MPSTKDYYVYIMSSKNRVLYIGVTNDLERRVFEHKSKTGGGFTSKYNVTRLVWFQSTPSIDDAIAFEKKLKGKSRAKKIALVESTNPKWEDLAADWY